MRKFLKKRDLTAEKAHKSNQNIKYKIILKKN